MTLKKDDIISHLREHILFLQGFKRSADSSTKIRLGPIDHSFPNNCFPLAAMHEFIAGSDEALSATTGFISHLVSQLMKNEGMCIWINSSATVYPPALKLFGIDPDRIVFIQVKKEKEMLWVMEEALKYEGLAAVIGEIREVGFTESRRFQLAVEKSKVTGFIIRNSPKKIGINTCVARWRITSIPSSSENELPGVGFPRWNIELLKIRNGKPGFWKMEYSKQSLHPVRSDDQLIAAIEKRKAG